MHRFGRLSSVRIKGQLQCLSPVTYSPMCTSIKASSHSQTHNLKFSWPCNLKQAYDQASLWLENAGIEDNEESARHLITHLTSIGYRLSDFNRELERPMTNQELIKYTEMCMDRAKHKPVQYIIGNWDFCGLQFICRPPILIPRPETEELVENILNTGYLQSLKSPRILDIGAGTGAIGISLLANLPTTATCCSIDINVKAVQLANENAQSILGSKYQERYCSVHMDFQSFAKEFYKQQQLLQRPQHSDCQRSQQHLHSEFSIFEPYDLIVSNPPYIPHADLLQLQPEILQYEDHGALSGGADGLDIVRELVHLAPLFFKSEPDSRYEEKGISSSTGGSISRVNEL